MNTEQATTSTPPDVNVPVLPKGAQLELFSEDVFLVACSNHSAISTDKTLNSLTTFVSRSCARKGNPEPATPHTARMIWWAPLTNEACWH